MIFHSFSLKRFSLSRLGLNRNFLAAFLGAALVAVFCIVDWFFPAADPVNAPVKSEAIPLPVAMYHHMLPTASRLNDYTISPEQFEQDLQYIQSCGYTTIGVKDLLAWAFEGSPLPPKPILITFDDGYESVHEYAYPLLQKYQMKAVVSIIGRHTDTFSVTQEYKSVNWSHLTWAQCREMQSSGLVEIQNHTYDLHDNKEGKRFGIRIKAGEPEDVYRRCIVEDVGGLNQKIEAELGTRPLAFAYPFGALCKESKPVLKDLGFQIIFTCEEKVNHLDQSGAGEGLEEPLVLRRFNRAHKYSTQEYFKKMGVMPS